jgi:hypothetical protein
MSHIIQSKLKNLARGKNLKFLNKIAISSRCAPFSQSPSEEEDL